jgi:acyl dehydratase
MPVNANAVGMRFGERIVDLTPRMMLAYAASIADTGAATFDDADSGSFMAPPQFCVSLEWPTVSDGGIHELLGTTPQEQLQTLHVGQDSTFHHPLVAGQRLKIFGTVMDVRETRAGTILISKLETIDDRSGKPVVTSWITALIRGVAVEGQKSPLEKAPNASEETPIQPQTVEIPVARELPHIYSECSGIWNPIHTERKVALAVGLPDIILHGTASWALAGREIARIYADGDYRKLRRLCGRFGAVIIPGNSMTLEHCPSVQSDNHICFNVRNSQGAQVIAGGIAEIEIEETSIGTRQA